MSGYAFAAVLVATIVAGWVAARAAARTLRLLHWHRRDARASWWEVL